MNFLKYIQSNKIVGLAPMDGYTDEPARLLQTKIAKADVMFTEFVCAEGLSRGSEKLFDPLLYSQTEQPILAQLFGKDPDSFYKAAIICFELGFAGVDINMGCPASKVVRHGGGASLIGRPDLAIKLIESVLKARQDWFGGKVNINNIDLKKKSLLKFEKVLKYCQYNGDKYWPTVSVKTRLGIDSDISTTWIEILVQSEIDLITLHGRTLKQGYAGVADWKAINKAGVVAKKVNPNIVFWGNGDITNKTMGLSFINKYGVDGVIIGRASVGNPWIFEDKQREISRQEKYNAMFLHGQLFQNVFPKRSLEHIRSKLLAYSKNFGNAKHLRKLIVSVAKIEDLANLEKDFLKG